MITQGGGKLSLTLRLRLSLMMLKRMMVTMWIVILNVLTGRGFFRRLFVVIEKALHLECWRM